MFSDLCMIKVAATCMDLLSSCWILSGGDRGRNPSCSPPSRSIDLLKSQQVTGSSAWCLFKGQPCNIDIHILVSLINRWVDNSGQRQSFRFPPSRNTMSTDIKFITSRGWWNELSTSSAVVPRWFSTYNERDESSPMDLYSTLTSSPNYLIKSFSRNLIR